MRIESHLTSLPGVPRERELGTQLALTDSLPIPFLSFLLKSIQQHFKHLVHARNWVKYGGIRQRKIKTTLNP